MTTDRAYLRTCTRRLVWKILAVSLVLALCVIDHPSRWDAGFYCDNLLFCLVVFAVPYSSPLMDFVVGAWTCADCWSTLRQDRTAGLYRSLISMFWMQIGGIHSLCMLPLLLVIFCVGDLFKGVDKGISPTTDAVCCVCMVSAVFLTEWQGAFLFHQLHGLVQMKQLLLDQTTDGQCTLSPETGAISDASAALVETLGLSTDGLGASIFDFVGPGDRDEVAGLLTGSRGPRPPGPILGTFLRRQASAGGSAAQFEAKLVPLAVCEGGLHVCLQRVGEERPLEARDPRPGAACAAGREAAGGPQAHGPPAETGHEPLAGLPWHDIELGTELSLSVSQSNEAPPSRRGPCARPVSDVSVQTDGHDPELGTEVGLGASQTGEAPHGRHTEPRTRAASVQTEPRRPPAQQVRPPLLPGAHLLAPPEAALPKRTRRHRQARQPPWAQLNSSRRQVPAFQQTPLSTGRDCLIDALERVNACGKGCCGLHVGTAAARRALDSIDLQACRELQHAGWQCPSCRVLIDRPACHNQARTMCDCCGEYVALVPPGGGPAPSSAHSLPPAVLEFSVFVDRSGGESLGVNLDVTVFPYCFLILAVGAGLVQDWNDAQEDGRVRVGDRLVEVNGIRGDKELMVAECRRHARLELVLQRVGRAAVQGGATDGAGGRADSHAVRGSSSSQADERLAPAFEARVRALMCERGCSRDVAVVVAEAVMHASSAP